VLTGTADLDRLAVRAPEMAGLDPEPLTLDEVEVLQANFEMAVASRQVTLPPGLHPTNPPMLVVLAWRVGSSPWGAFSMAQVRVGSRSGVRPRGFVAGCVVDGSSDAVAALASRWGLPAVAGTVALERRYDGTGLCVEVGGRTAAELSCLGPDPLSAGDVQYTVTMTLARTPRGLRLVQLEPEYDVRRVERLVPRLVRFDGAAWGDDQLRPVHPISATVAVAAVTIPRLRFVCRPDVLAFEGTEAVP
jgi:hypothetical protein